MTRENSAMDALAESRDEVKALGELLRREGLWSDEEMGRTIAETRPIAALDKA
jgi:hypothetical protein